MIAFMSLLCPLTSKRNSGFSSRLDDSWLTAAGSGLFPNQNSKKKNQIESKFLAKPDPKPEHKIKSNSPANPANRGITLIEVLIVVAILAFLLVVIYFAANQQLFKARDGKRKADLNQLSVILEDFYNNNGCYPRPTEICYDALADDVESCYICGREADPLPNYRLPCNPDHPHKKYLYEVEDSECPQWYRIYTELSHTDDSGPCPYGICGPEGGYDYGVSSPNVGLDISDRLYAYSEPNCGHCGETVAECKANNADKIYGTQTLCCEYHNYEPNNCNWAIWDGDNCFICKGTQTECIEQYPSSHYSIYSNLYFCCNANDCD